jgi:ribonucleoside-triphosphate reductase
LVEINLKEVKNEDEFFLACAAAATLATVQASYTDFIYLRPEWKKVSEEDALIGVGLTGIAGCDLSEKVLEIGAEVVKFTNQAVAKELGINSAARTTTVKPAGTTSLVLGTSSGIHAWHSKYYLRSLRLGKTEAIAQYLMKECPNLVEQDIMNPSQIIIRVPQKAPEGAILREAETSFQLLDRVLKYQHNWVRPGHDRGANFNNVSVTVSVKPDEWHDVGKWMWEHRHDYNGISVLPFSDHTYKQAPFESITETQYNALIPFLKSVDLTQVKEITDNTELVQELACAGGVCEII